MSHIAWIFLIGVQASAVLGGRTFDLELFANLKAKSTTTHAVNNCYSVKVSEGDGLGLKEYLNQASNHVFMIRYTSRGPLQIEPLLSKSDFSEFLQARKVGTQSVRSVSRNHRSAFTETPRFKVRVENGPLVHRAWLVSKTDVPRCVDDAETLP